MYHVSFLLSRALSQGPVNILVFLLLRSSVAIQKSGPSELKGREVAC